MKRILTLALLVFMSLTAIEAKNKIKNVILMIPDGTSWASVSSARWFQRYNNPGQDNLFIDPYLCGSILTTCSNAPIGDSAPTTSCFVTGYPSIAGWVSTYPESYGKNDLVPIDSTRAYQPLTTVLEAARLTQNKATGLVFTCEFPHATPADCAAHCYNRSRYNWIAPQMVHNSIDVVIGGGVSILRDEDKDYLKNEGYGLFLNDIDGYRKFDGNRMWALFCDKDMSFDVDRNPAEEPSLEEMTGIAIDKLSKNKNGFFLMVEGSKVDWAAHANDARAIISDMLAFDRACGVALDFARRDGNTVVVIVPDHGNSGISIGAKRCPNYAKLSKDELFASVSKFKTSIDGLIKELHKTSPDSIRSKMLELTGITLTDDEYGKLLKCGDYGLSTLTDDERMKGTTLTHEVSTILQAKTCFGFTTGGHTGEEVFLAVYDPTPARMTGHHTNIELNHYLRSSLGLPQTLESLTDRYFAKYDRVFAGHDCVCDTVQHDASNPKKTPSLQVGEKYRLTITPNTNIVRLNDHNLHLTTVVVFVDKNGVFYLPEALGQIVNARDDKELAHIIKQNGYRFD